MSSYKLLSTILNKMLTAQGDKLPVSQTVIEFETKEEANNVYDRLNRSEVLSRDKFQARIIEKLYE